MHQLAYHHQRGDEIRLLGDALALRRHPCRNLRQLVEGPLDFVDLQLGDGLPRIPQYVSQGRQHGVAAFQYFQRFQV